MGRLDKNFRVQFFLISFVITYQFTFTEQFHIFQYVQITRLNGKNSYVEINFSLPIETGRKFCLSNFLIYTFSCHTQKIELLNCFFLTEIWIT